jgi:hypothetical protein
MPRYLHRGTTGAYFITVRAIAKTMNREPLFDGRVWLTPIVIAISGIAVALFALVLR